MQSSVSLIEFFLIPIYIFLIFLIARNIQRKNILIHPEFKYFTKGLLIKLVSVIFFCSCYVYIYGNGDTLSYFRGARCLVNLLYSEFYKGVSLTLDLYNAYNKWGSFNASTGYPPAYIFRDPNSFIVSRLTTIFCIFGFRYFYLTSILVCCFSYSGIWKLYRVFCYYNPNLSKKLFYTILCIPSIAFWGSGIMKDSFVLSSACWATFNFFKIFIVKEKRLMNLILLILNFWILINIKSYVAISLIPGMLIWINTNNFKKIKSTSLKIILRPLILVFTIGLFSLLYQNLSLIGLEKYENIEETIESAKVIQQDLLREEQYGSNSYYIGELDGTFTGMLRLAPAAIFTSIFRPFIWESNNFLMALSGIENSVLIILFVVLFIRVSPLSFIKKIFTSPLLLFSFSFIIFLGFGVGIASTNFGALVRYRIPILPFIYPLLTMIRDMKNNPSSS